MKKIFGISGEMGAGKGTVASYLADRYGASVRAFSDSLKDVADRMHLEKSRENLQKISSIFRENFHDNILSEIVFEDAKRDKAEIVVIDGVRRRADIEFFKDMPGFKLLYVEADIKARHQRIIKRGEKSDDNSKTFEEFERDHLREAEKEILGLKKIADFVIDNNGNFKQLYQQVDKIIKNNR
jgi:dephospho-CoA kinase